MLRVSKLTDYGTVVMVFLAQAPREYHKANSIAVGTDLALPTVSKILKRLARAGLLESLRGNNGGYRLALVPTSISVAHIVRALEGPVALTECSSSDRLCSQESSCSIRPNWQKINRAVLGALESISLAELIHPMQVPVIERPVVVPEVTDSLRWR